MYSPVTHTYELQTIPTHPPESQEPWLSHHTKHAGSCTPTSQQQEGPTPNMFSLTTVTLQTNVWHRASQTFVDYTYHVKRLGDFAHGHNESTDIS